MEGHQRSPGQDVGPSRAEFSRDGPQHGRRIIRSSPEGQKVNQTRVSSRSPDRKDREQYKRARVDDRSGQIDDEGSGRRESHPEAYASKLTGDGAENPSDRANSDVGGEYNAESKEPDPDFGLSGALAAETNTIK